MSNLFWKFDDKKTYQHWATVNGIFSPPELKEILSYKDRVDKKEGKVGGGIVDVTIRNNSIWWVEPSPDTEWLFDRIEGVVHQLNSSFFHLNIEGMRNLQITEYDAENSQHYSAHVDAGTGETHERRKLSVSIQLTDPSSYEGAQLLLYPVNLKPISCVKDVGSITVFRSHILHEVTPITRGTRFSLVAWVEGPVIC